MAAELLKMCVCVCACVYLFVSSSYTPNPAKLGFREWVCLELGPSGSYAAYVHICLHV